MNVIVQKFGGSSMATMARIKQVADTIIRTQAEQNSAMVVVVSAMGDDTDQLIALAQQVQAEIVQSREYDMLLSTGEQKAMALLALALQAKGQVARSLTAAQAGIHSDAEHGHAQIIDIDTQRIQPYLVRGEIVIIAGFQAMYHDEITTLGRGGSDLSAVALAAALKAKECQIYTDVDGVYFTDPNIIPGAHKLNLVSFDEMIALAQQGAKVLHHRSVILAKKMHVPLRVLSSFSVGEGTKIDHPPPLEPHQYLSGKITGIASQQDQALIKLSCAMPKAQYLLSHAQTQLQAKLAAYPVSISDFTATDLMGRVDQIDLVDLQDSLRITTSIVLPSSLIHRISDELINFFAPYIPELTIQQDLTQVALIGPRIQSDPEALQHFDQVLQQFHDDICHRYTRDMTLSVLVNTPIAKPLINALFAVFHARVQSA